MAFKTVEFREVKEGQRFFFLELDPQPNWVEFIRLEVRFEARLDLKNINRCVRWKQELISRVFQDSETVEVEDREEK